MTYASSMVWKKTQTYKSTHIWKSSNELSEATPWDQFMRINTLTANLLLRMKYVASQVSKTWLRNVKLLIHYDRTKRQPCCILSRPNPTSKKTGPDWWILAKDNNTIQHHFTSNINVYHCISMSCKGDITICSDSKTLMIFFYFFAKGQRQGIMRTPGHV